MSVNRGQVSGIVHGVDYVTTGARPEVALGEEIVAVAELGQSALGPNLVGVSRICSPQLRNMPFYRPPPAERWLPQYGVERKDLESSLSSGVV